MTATLRLGSRRSPMAVAQSRQVAGMITERTGRVAPGPQAPQIWRPVRERLRRPRLIGVLASRVPECSDTDGIVAEETRRLVQSFNLPVDLIAHRDGRPRRRPASS